MDDESLKTHRLIGDADIGMNSIQKGQDMSEEDRKILAGILLGVVITEVYSPESVARKSVEFGLVAGSSVDLTNGWESTRAGHGRAAWIQVGKDDPYLLVGSPPCTRFSVLQDLNLHGNHGD